MRREAPNWSVADATSKAMEWSKRLTSLDERKGEMAETATRKRKLSEVRAAEHPRRASRAAAHRVGTRPLPPTGAAHAWRRSRRRMASRSDAPLARRPLKMQRIYHEALAARDSVRPPYPGPSRPFPRTLEQRRPRGALAVRCLWCFAALCSRQPVPRPNSIGADQATERARGSNGSQGGAQRGHRRR